MQAYNFFDQLRMHLVNNQRGYFIGAMVATIIVFLAMCLIFEDNGAKCWYLVIPFYNLYTKFRIIWRKSYFYVHLALSIIAFVAILAVAVTGFSIALSNTNSIGYGAMPNVAVSIIVTMMVGMAIWCICITIIGIIEILLEYNLSRTYKHDGLFTVGLILLPVIFYVIIAVQCIKFGVLNKIPTGRKVFMVVCVILLIALTVLPIYLHLV